MTTRTVSDRLKTLRAAALKLPETEEGVACEGTAVEKRTLKARDKAFLFLGATDVMLKLRESLAEATRLAFKEPARCSVGAHGWVTLKLDDDAQPTDALLAKWMDESYRLLAPKSLTSRPPPPSTPKPKATAAPKPTATPKKKSKKKK